MTILKITLILILLSKCGISISEWLCGVTPYLKEEKRVDVTKKIATKALFIGKVLLLFSLIFTVIFILSL